MDERLRRADARIAKELAACLAATLVVAFVLASL